jgi:hypothetical protein
VRIGTSEEDDSTANYWRSPDFSPGRRFPQLASGLLINGVHFSVIASEQDSIFGKRRRRMNRTRRLKFPFRSACDYIDGVQYSIDRRDIQDSIVQYRCGTHGAAGTKLPGRSFRRMCLMLSLTSRPAVVFEQRGPVSLSFRLGCFRCHQFRPRGYGDQFASGRRSQARVPQPLQCVRVGEKIGFSLRREKSHRYLR